MLLSLLDKSPLQKGEGAATALARTVRLAQTAERLGYHRFWLAEHHGMQGFASAVPEVLIAHILGKTSRIRVGSGGIMLQHYSAYKVAETFNTLAALAPGRVDLGIGKAPGGFPYSTKALQAGRDVPRWPSFDEQVTELDGYLARCFERGAPAQAVASPIPPAPPERFLLGGSIDSAILAAERGWGFVFAGHMNGDPALTEQSLAAFARHGGRGTPLLSVLVLAAEAKGEAEARVEGLGGVKVRFATGHSVNLGNREQAAEYARQAGTSDYEVIDTKPNVLAGTSEQVHRELDLLRQRFGVEEFVIETPPVPADARQKTIELLGARIGAAPAPV
ncbi:MAG: MsnO8 family LLM class oxidoreductase [Rhizomicrobium sp.]